MAKFAEVLHIKNGRNQRQVENLHGQYPIYGSGGVIGYADDYICEAEAVVIGRKGSINKPIFVDKPFWNVDTAFGLIANHNKLIPKYLYFFCCQYDFERLNTTVTIPSLTKANLLQIEMPVPGLSTQRRIAAILDAVTSLIAKHKRQLAQLDLLVKSQFVEMFGAGVGNSAVELKEICSIITDGTHQPPKFTNEGIPFLLVSNIVDNEITYDTEKYITREDYEILIKRTPLEIGDLLLTTVGSYGNPAIVRTEREFCFQRHIAYMKPKKDAINSVYLHAAFMSDAVREQIEVKVKGIAQKTLNLSELKTIRVELPPLPLQTRFADFVRQADKSKSAIQQALDKLDLLYKALMQRYFG
jgi:type I restriction enzyme S subunit